MKLENETANVRGDCVAVEAKPYRDVGVYILKHV